MKKKNIAALSVGIVSAAALTIGVSSTGIIQKIHSELRPDFTIQVDGQTKTFKNADGEVVYPILYNGSTYLPVRAIGELMGKTVYWYDADKRIDLKTEGYGAEVTDADVIVTGKEIGLEQAKKIALDHAGITVDGVIFLEAELDNHNGILEYELTFLKGDVKYSAEIKADDGTILDWDIDKKKDSAGIGGGDFTAVKPDGYITAEKAVAVALEKAGLARADIVLEKAEFSKDDGLAHYEIEFKKDGVEYSAEIKAADGTILEWDVEKDD